MAKLTGKVAVITGAVGTLGQALCRQLSRHEGVTIWATDIDEEGLATLEKNINSYASEVRTRRVDVCEPSQLKDLALEVLKRDKRIDYWINNAALPPGVGLFKDMPAQHFEKIFDINFMGVVNGSRVALQYMHDEGRGLIVNIASVSGLVSAPYINAYSSAKHAVVGFTRSLQTELELTDSQVRTLLVCPGFFKSTMIDDHEATKFPTWLRWILSDADSVARDITSGIKHGKTELISSFNGHLMQRMHAIAPRTTRRSAKLLLAKTFKDVLLNRFDL